MNAVRELTTKLCFVDEHQISYITTKCNNERHRAWINEHCNCSTIYRCVNIIGNSVVQFLLCPPSVLSAGLQYGERHAHFQVPSATSSIYLKFVIGEVRSLHRFPLFPLQIIAFPKLHCSSFHLLSISSLRSRQIHLLFVPCTLGILFPDTYCALRSHLSCDFFSSTTRRIFFHQQPS